jgi:hypothetical protein
MFPSARALTRLSAGLPSYLTSGVRVILNWVPLVVESGKWLAAEEGCLNIARLPLQNRLRPADAWCGTGLDEQRSLTQGRKSV